MAKTRATRPSQAAGGPSFVEVSPLQLEQVMENNEPRVCLSESGSEEHLGEAPVNSARSPTYVDLIAEMKQAQAIQTQQHQAAMAEVQRQMATLTRVVNVCAQHLPVEILRDPAKGKGTTGEDHEAPTKPRVPVAERLVFGGMKKEAAKARAGDPIARSKGSLGAIPEDRPRASVFSRIGVPDLPEHSQSRSRKSRTRSRKSKSGKQDSLSTARRSRGDSELERGCSIPHENVTPNYSLTPAELEVINAMRRSLGQVAHPPLQTFRAVELLQTGGSVAPGVGTLPFTPIQTPNRTGEVAGGIGKHVVSAGATLGPFTPEVVATPYPPKFRGPTIPTFEGKTSPLEHVERYANLMQSQSVADAILCKHFTTTLAGPAADWFRQLARGSIASFAQLAQSLVDQFQSLHHQQKDSDHLLSLKQGLNETFTAFLRRFRAETLKVNNLCTKTAANAFKAAVVDPHFLFKLSKEKMK